MITIQINEKPILEAKDCAVGAMTKAGKTAGAYAQVAGSYIAENGAAVARVIKDGATAVSNFVKENFTADAANIAYYSSIAGSLATYSSGSLFSPLALACNLTTYASVKALQAAALNGKLSPGDRKAKNVASANLFANVMTQAIPMPNVKLALTAYNILSDHIKVNVK